MARRGKKAARIKTPGSRTRQDIRRLLRKAGSLERYIDWGKEEKQRIDREESREAFDKAMLETLRFMEETSWKYQRSPEARRIFKRRNLEMGTPQARLLTREEIVRQMVKARWKYSPEEESHLAAIEDPAVRAAWHTWKRSLGQSEKAIVKRLIRKLRGGKHKPPH